MIRTLLCNYAEVILANISDWIQTGKLRDMPAHMSVHIQIDFKTNRTEQREDLTIVDPFCHF